MLEREDARERGAGRSLRERAVAKGREVLEEANEYIDKQRETIEQRRERLAAAVDAGRQAYREEKEKK